MTDENRLIITLETDSNGKLQLTDKSVFDKLTAYDYVKYFIDASKELLHA